MEHYLSGIDLLLAEQLFWQYWPTLVVLSVALLCLFVQLYFNFRWFRKLANYKKPENQQVRLKPISIVICVRNNMAGVKAIIEALQEQNYPLFEIVMVDDRSGDEVYDYLLSVRDNYKYFKLRRIEVTPQRMNAKKFALTMGIKAASYEHILFTDDDCLPSSPNWVRLMQAGFYGEAKEIVLGYSPYRRYKGLLNSLIRFETFYTGIQYLSLALGGRPYMGVGRNLGYTKDLFFQYKGFYKHIQVTGGDDDLFINRTATEHNVSVVVEPDAQMISEPKRTFRQWYKQKMRHFSVGKYYKAEDQSRLSWLGGTYIFFWFSVMALAAMPPYGWAIALGIVLTRAITQGAIWGKCSKVLKEGFSPWAIPFLDFLYLFCFLYFIVKASTTKRIAWN